MAENPETKMVKQIVNYSGARQGPWTISIIGNQWRVDFDPPIGETTFAFGPARNRKEAWKLARAAIALLLPDAQQPSVSMPPRDSIAFTEFPNG
mgnify:CR=1 FL=1